MAGVVAAAAAGVTRFPAGDQVYGTCEERLVRRVRGRTGEAAGGQTGQTALRAGRGRAYLWMTAL